MGIYSERNEPAGNSFAESVGLVEKDIDFLDTPEKVRAAEDHFDDQIREREEYLKLARMESAHAASFIYLDQSGLHFWQ